MEKRGLTAQLKDVGWSDPGSLFWGDEMRLGLIGQVRKVWAPRGVKVEQLVEYEHQWAYLNLAVNGLTGQLRWAWTENMKGASIAPVVKTWSTTGVAVLIWDRARGHRGPAYTDVPVQRYLRDKVEGKIYGTVVAKQQAVETELEKLVTAPEAVRSLAGWTWIRQSVSTLLDPNMVFQ